MERHLYADVTMETCNWDVYSVFNGISMLFIEFSGKKLNSSNMKKIEFHDNWVGNLSWFSETQMTKKVFQIHFLV